LRWLQSVFGSDGSPIVQYIVIFAVIFTALAAIVFTVRRLTGRSLALPGRSGSRGRQPRLGIVDVYELDRARQLILLRRDNVEHLLLVGGPNDVVVERNIQRGQRPLPEAAIRPDLAPEPLDEPLPDPLVQGGRLPEPPRGLPESGGRRAEPLFDPGFAMPVVVPSPVPRSASAPPVTLPLDPGLFGGDEPGQDVTAPLRAAPPQPPAPQPPAPPAPEPVVPPPMESPPIAPPAVETPALPPREPVAPRRILSRTAPPLIEPRPNPASERKPEPAPAEPEPARLAPSLAVPSERKSVDPVVLSDMARQLQAALSRSSSAVTPPPQPAPAPPAPEGVDPLAAAMASVPVEPVPAPAPVEEPEAPPPPPPPPAKPVPPPAMPKVEPPPPVTAPPPPSAPTPDAKGSGNPFSVEEIEAEFARLLGRPLDKRS
jgi:flagellar protein FliO/FliZ